MVLLIQLGCQKQSMEKSNVQAHLNEEKTISSQGKTFKITISAGGGFTGLVKGFKLYSSGKVEHWQRFPAQNDSILWSHKVNANQIAEFKQQLEQSGMLRKTIRETGNMTTIVTFETPDSNYTWSWRGVGAQGNIPKELKIWSESVREFCNQIAKKQSEC